MATKRILGLPTLEPEELGEGLFVPIDNAKIGNRKVDLGGFMGEVNAAIEDIESGTALAEGAVTTDKIAEGAVTNDKLSTNSVETDNLVNGNVTTEKLATAAVTNDKMAVNAVNTENVVNGAITNDKLAQASVETGNIADGNVTTDKLASAAITNDKLASNAVEADNIKDGDVGTSELAAGAVTNAKLATDAVDTSNIKNSAVTTDKMAEGAVTNAKLATDAVGTTNIKDGSVTTDKLASGAVTNPKLAANAVETGNIKDANVTTDKLTDGAVTNPKLATNAVETTNIKDANVTTDKLSSGAVTNAKLATNAVETGNIKDGNVTNTKLADGSVTTSKIQNGSVTLEKIATGSAVTQSTDGLMTHQDKTKLDGFTQASDYALKTDISSAINYRGSVATESELPSSGQKVGDMYNIVAASSYGAAGTNVAWTGSAWDSLGEKFTIGDGTLTPIMVSSGYTFMTDAEQTKLSGIEAEANKTVVDSTLSGSSTNPVQNSVVKEALDLKAPLASPALTGTPTAPTAASGTNTTQVATTAFVKSAVDAKFPVVNTDVAADAVDTTNIKNGAVTTDKLGANAVTHAKLASNAVEADSIKDGEVGTSELASGAVTNDKLASNAVETANIKDANVTNAKLASNAVETANIKDGNVTHIKLATDAVEAGNIKDGEVGTNKLAANAVTNAKLATDAVGTSNIIDANVTNAKLATDAVETTNIKDANVTATKLSAQLQKQLIQLNSVVEYIRYGVRGLKSNTWPYVAGLADLGEDALDLIPIGTELTDKWNDTHAATAVNYDFPWLVQSLEKFIFENQIEPMYGIVLGAKYTLPFGTQFDEKEAFYTVGPEGLVAGTYYFTWGFTWGSASVVTGNTYTFTTTNDYSEGAQFVFANQPQSSEIDGTNVDVYSTCGGTTIVETCVLTKNNIEGATSLGTITTNQIVEGQLLNHGHRCCYGNGNWAESAIRQYLNTWADGGTWWLPQNKWDRPPSYANYDGFMKGLPSELRAVIQKTKVVTALSYSADGGTAAAPETVVTYDYFFLPSWEQHWLKVENNYGAQEGLEGTPFPYWKKVSGVTTPWAAGTTHSEYIHYDLANHNTARHVFLRSSLRGNGASVSCILSSGACYNTYALGGHYVVPVCVIRKAIA